jgi:hypothetical protein
MIWALNHVVHHWATGFSPFFRRGLNYSIIRVGLLHLLLPFNVFSLRSAAVYASLIGSSLSFLLVQHRSASGMGVWFAPADPRWGIAPLRLGVLPAFDPTLLHPHSHLQDESGVPPSLVPISRFHLPHIRKLRKSSSDHLNPSSKCATLPSLPSLVPALLLPLQSLCKFLTIIRLKQQTPALKTLKYQVTTLRSGTLTLRNPELLSLSKPSSSRHTTSMSICWSRRGRML